MGTVALEDDIKTNMGLAKKQAMCSNYLSNAYGLLDNAIPYAGKTWGTVRAYRAALYDQSETEEYDEPRAGMWGSGQVPVLAMPHEVLTQDVWDDSIRDLLMTSIEGVITFAGVMGDVAIPLGDDAAFPGLRDFTDPSYLASLRGGYAGAFSDRVDLFSDYIMTLAKSDMSTEINRLAAPMLAGLEEERKREVNRAQTKYTAGNGFFNSGINHLVADIDHRWGVLKADKLAELTKDFRQHVYAVASQVLSTLANWKNPAIEQSLDIERFRLSSSMAMAQLNIGNLNTIEQMTLGAVTYAKEEINRILFNTKQVRDRYLTLSRWEAEYLSILANVSGSGQTGSSGLMETITNTAMGGLQIATGIAGLAMGMSNGALGVAGGVETLIKGKK
jgi:hypothetical protein